MMSGIFGMFRRKTTSTASTDSGPLVVAAPSSPTAPRIFVSYSHKDDAFTQRLVGDLHQAGAEVWVDQAGIQHGNFMQRIDDALAQCEWMVLVLTPNAIASEYVKREVYTALNRVAQGYMRDVIPILAARCAPGTIPPQWDVLQRYDATEGYAAARNGLIRAIRLNSAGQSQPPAPLQPPEGQIASAVTYTAEGWKLYGLNRRQEALAAFDRALALDPNYRDAWNGKGVALDGLGRHGEALEAFDRALDLDRGFAAAWYGKGWALSNAGRHQEALAAFDHALALNPNYVDAWNGRGWALNNLGRREEALAAFDRALDLAPNAATWTSKAITLRALGREVEAQEAERRAKELGG